MQHTIYTDFEFHRSHLAYVVHCLAFIIIQIVFYCNLPPIFWSICLILQIICSALFLRQQIKPLYLGFLDDGQWTLITQNHHQKSPQKQHVSIANMLDHQLYIVIYFDAQQKIKPLIIWRDQLDDQHWKGLKTRAKFKAFYR